MCLSRSEGEIRVTGDVLLNVQQVFEATGIPKGALVKMASSGVIPAIAAGREGSPRRYWRVRLSQLDEVRAGYQEWKRQESARRVQGQLNAERRPALTKRVELLEAQMARLLEALEMQPMEPEPND
jgi:hypothetical protein